eukprot:TRINITY_DN91326_c0_g1_i1.p1 TRINITY_DN91326_c0_g1~~TRINITY_DN91326_c0_g1_i1.p1  ORF type:complete len:419 (+),score=86.56 TRINITY_DN91326_c0_g1_i1:106-1362(+)
MSQNSRARDAVLLAAGALGGAALTAFLLRRQRTEHREVLAPACVAAAEKQKADFLKALQGHLRGGIVVAMVFLGDKLGLYRTMAAGQRGSVEGWTAARLAKAAGGLQPRLVQEWLSQQAAVGLLGFDATAKTFTLPKHHAAFLAEELSGSFFAAYATLLYACYARLPSMLQSFRGKCLAPTYDEAGDEVADAMARLHLPEFKFHLIPDVFPLVLNGKLQQQLYSGQLVCADVGCSGADCTLELAKRFPGSHFYAYEVAIPALERADLNVQKSQCKNVTVVDAKKQPLGNGAPTGKGLATKFDFVLCYDVLHDLADPEALMREVRDVLSPEGVWLVVDITAHEDFAANIEKHPGAGTYYGISVCLCLPSGLSAEGGRGLGTLGFPPQVAEDMFRRCGFSRVRSFKMPGLEKNTCYEVQI